MKTLTPAERRACRARAHSLHPVVAIGHHGLTPGVLHEIDTALIAHELIKIRVFSDERAEREALLVRICEELDAAPVQHLGKILIVYRSAPEPAEPAPAPRPRAVPGSKPRTRMRAPATAKGPSEPGPRTPRRPGPRGSSEEAAPRRRTASAASPRHAPGGTQAKPAARRRRSDDVARPPQPAATRRRRPGTTSASAPSRPRRRRHEP